MGPIYEEMKKLLVVCGIILHSCFLTVSLLQIQVVPVPKVSARTLRSTFLNVAREKGVNLSTLKDVEEV